MIARFRILLFHTLSIPTDVALTPFDLSIEGKSVRVFPPMKAGTSISELALSNDPVSAIAAKLAPSEQKSDMRILINGVPTVAANMLQFEISDSQFNRQQIVSDTNLQPEFRLVFKALNQVMARLRTVTRAGDLKPFSPDQTVWAVQYLNDDGSELPKQEGFFRGRGSKYFKLGAIGINAETWHSVQTLPDELVQRTWEALILDARSALPEVGPSIVLAATALEIFIAYVLDILESRLQPQLPAELWEWINDRGDFWKDPSTEERFDKLLKILSGKSLKEESVLWAAFKNIKNARNKFVHEGRVLSGGNPIDAAKAAEFVTRAEDIIAWIEKLLPVELQRKQFPPAEISFAIPILSP